MNEKYLGVVEGFFGPSWPENKRKSYAKFLSDYGGDFYIYAPKEDPYLRKKWRESWDESYIQKLTSLSQTFRSYGIDFGVGLSPFGLGTHLSPQDKEILRDKISILNRLEVDLLGIFFDDMPTNVELASTQIEVVNFIQSFFSRKMIFCPSYYSYDPILEKVFGKMPDGYFDDIANGIPQNISIAWTGPKVISETLPCDHLQEVNRILKRKPFIWENVFANDGPKNCKFLKLRPYSGRDSECLKTSEAFAFNMMNQAELSKITFLSSKLVLADGMNPNEAWLHALNELVPQKLQEFILTYQEQFQKEGLDRITLDEKKKLLSYLEKIEGPASVEICDWLKGKFIVGSECLTD